MYILFAVIIWTASVIFAQTAPDAQTKSEVKPAEKKSTAISKLAPKPLYTPDIVEKPEKKLIDKEGAGKLYQVNDHLVCVMEGTPEEMGYQHGRLLAKRIHHIMKVGYLQKALWSRGYKPEYVNAQSARMEKHFPPEYIAELQGIVKGVKAAGVEGISYEDARLGLTIPELLHFDPDMPPGCSNFAVWGKWTTDGRLLHGRNLDWTVEAEAQDDHVILIWRPKGGIPFMMVGWAGSIGSVSGMNAKGITIGEMTCMSPDATFDGLPLNAIMRRVLEKAETLEQAVEIMKNTPRTSGWNFVIADGKIPDARALEVDAKNCDVYAPMDPKEGKETMHWAMQDAVRRTNHPISAERLLKLGQTYGHEIGIEIKTMEDLKAKLPLLLLQNTYQRYDWLGKQIQQRGEGKFDVKDALQLLANGPVFGDDTLHSFVFDPSKQVAYVANAGSNPPKTATRMTFTRLDLSEWFK